MRLLVKIVSCLCLCLCLAGCLGTKNAPAKGATTEKGRAFWCCNEHGFCEHKAEGCNPPGQDNCAGACYETQMDCLSNGNCTPE